LQSIYTPADAVTPAIGPTVVPTDQSPSVYELIDNSSSIESTRIRRVGKTATIQPLVLSFLRYSKPSQIHPKSISNRARASGRPYLRPSFKTPPHQSRCHHILHQPAATSRQSHTVAEISVLGGFPRPFLLLLYLTLFACYCNCIYHRNSTSTFDLSSQLPDLLQSCQFRSGPSLAMPCHES
jgi:hypothetical protein